MKKIFVAFLLLIFSFVFAQDVCIPRKKAFEQIVSENKHNLGFWQEIATYLGEDYSVVFTNGTYSLVKLERYFDEEEYALASAKAVAQACGNPKYDPASSSWSWFSVGACNTSCIQIPGMTYKMCFATQPIAYVNAVGTAPVHHQDKKIHFNVHEKTRNIPYTLKPSDIPDHYYEDLDNCVDPEPEEPEKPPCFGNACEDGDKEPDYIDPETGIPCFGNNCGELPPPDSIDDDGVPCWGDYCTNRPEVVIDPETGIPCIGNGCGGGKPGTGGDGDGDGSGTGDGDGDGSGTGDGDGDGNCKGSNCSGSGLGEGKVPDLSNKNAYTPKIEGGLAAHIMENPIQIDNTKLGQIIKSLVPNFGGGSCPKYVLPPLISGMSSVDVSPPCWIFGLIKSLVLIGACVYARQIILGA